jgi:NADH:ubiquinone oxidoreductase subunit K
MSGNMFTDISLVHYLLVGAVLFVIGLLVVTTRRNAIGVLIGIELMLNSAGLNFVAFNKYSAPGRLDGQIFTIFIIILAAAEAAAALAIILNIFNQTNSINVDDAHTLKQ